MNIIETAAANPDFSTLVTAVKAADLVDTLSGAGPFTVFAPTNAAFAKMPDATLRAVLEDKAKIASILSYHVVAGKASSKDVSTLTEVTTIQGKKIAVDALNSIKVNNANVIKTDIECSNGVIHAIDTVLMP